MIVAQAQVLLQETITELIPGDLDLDGDVDFSDFLTFAQNFGKSGSAPTPLEPVVITTIDTVIVTVRDTFEITYTTTIRDTITIPLDTIKVSLNLSDTFILGPILFADVDVQVGASDRVNSDVRVVNVFATDQDVTIDIFARGYDGSEEMNALFRVSDRAKMTDPRVTFAGVFPFTVVQYLEGNGFNILKASIISGPVSETGDGLKHLASFTFNALESLDVTFISLK